MARRSFRRRRQGGLWLPVLGYNAQNNADDYVMGCRGYTPVLADGSIVVTVDEVTFDYKPNPWEVQTTATDFSPTLHEITSGNEWRLRRIVGKWHATYTTPSFDFVENAMTVPAVEYAAGYMVLKTDEEGAPLTDLDEVNPLVMESAEDPWIWRRKWILGNAHAGVSGQVPADDLQKGLWNAGVKFPFNTELFGSVADGPHIDQKTNRIIHRQERLFLFSATRLWAPIPWTSGMPEPGFVFYNVDHRFFGSLSSSRGNRRNASR